LEELADVARIWAAIKRESILVVSEGVSEPAEIDDLLGETFGIRPFHAIDDVGLDVARDIEKHYLDVRPDVTRHEVVDLLQRYIDQGRYGTKSGRGFFEHPTKTTDNGDQDHIICLDIARGTIFSINLNDSSIRTIVSGLPDAPDGIQHDDHRLYWTCMGRDPKANDGRVVSALLDGSDIRDIVQAGQTFTPKQLHLDSASQTLYWCDREGGKIQKCKTDGTDLRTIYDSAPNAKRPLVDATLWCVGVAVDEKRELIYWTQKGTSKGSVGRIFRMPFGGSAPEIIFQNLPEPIDLVLDTESQTLYCE